MRDGVSNHNPEHQSLKVCIVLPTYNEAGNIKRALDSVFRQEKIHGKKERFTITALVVDDSSPDGTANIVRAYQKKNKNVHLLLRKEKNGLGAAYIAGMKHAMKAIKSDVVMQMDSDGQHNPADIPRLIAAIHNGADFVIGSRYVPGGSIPDTWGFDRRFKSACANAVTRVGLGLGNVRDCSGGFRAVRSTILQKIDFNALHVRGYAFQPVFLEEALFAGAIVKEVPIAFLDRDVGVSKMRFVDMIEGGLLVLRIRAKRLFSTTTTNRKKVPAKTES